MGLILVCDDEASATLSWADALRSVPGLSDRFEVQAMNLAQLQESIEALERRRFEARAGELPAYDLLIDRADVLIVDFDLLNVSEKGFITGESLAYLARCYSMAGPIVALNQFYRDNSFDLNLLQDLDSFADVNISDKQITNQGLWQSQWSGDFRPWHWPLLPDLVQKYVDRVESIANRLDDVITDFLGFPHQAFDFIDRDTQAFIASGDQDLSEVTFRNFVSNSGRGLRGRDVQPDDRLVSRIAAARVGAWLERAILVTQNALVDLPHLVERTPSVVCSDEFDLEKVNLCARFDETYLITSAALEPSRFRRSEWLSRSAWWWPLIEEQEALPELREPWKFKRLPVMFCEDTSRFVEHARVHGFVAAIASPFARRYVERLPDVHYRPQVRFVG